MKKEKQYLILLVIVTIISILSLLTILTQKNSKIVELETQIENLSTESFINSNEVGRYDLALDSLKIVNPKAEKQFQDILNSGQYE
jgi:cell division protein FtsL